MEPHSTRKAGRDTRTGTDPLGSTEIFGRMDGRGHGGTRRRGRWTWPTSPPDTPLLPFGRVHFERGNRQNSFS